MKKLFLALFVILMITPANIIIAGSSSEFQEQTSETETSMPAADVFLFKEKSISSSQSTGAHRTLLTKVMINGFPLQDPPIEYFENKAYMPFDYIAENLEEKIQFEYSEDFFKVCLDEPEKTCFNEFTYILTDDLKEAENNAALIYNETYYFPLRHFMNRLGYETTYYAPENSKNKQGRENQSPFSGCPVITIDKTVETFSSEETSDDLTDTLFPLFNTFSEDLMVNNDTRDKKSILV